MKRLRRFAPCLLLGLGACIDFVEPAVPQEKAPGLSLQVVAQDSADLRAVRVSARLSAGRDEGGRPHVLTDSTVRVGELRLRLVPTEPGVFAADTALFHDEAGRFLDTFNDAPLHAPGVHGYPPQSLHAFLPRRAGPPSWEWRGDDLVLQPGLLDPPPGLDAPRWQVSVRAPAAPIVGVQHAGPLPPELVIPAAMLGACTPGPLLARMDVHQFAAPPVLGNAYPIAVATVLVVWWTPVRSCG